MIVWCKASHWIYLFFYFFYESEKIIIKETRKIQPPAQRLETVMILNCKTQTYPYSTPEQDYKNQPTYHREPPYAKGRKNSQQQAPKDH